MTCSLHIMYVEFYIHLPSIIVIYIYNMFFYKQNYHATSALCSFQLLKAWASALQACTHTHTHTHTFFSPSRAAAAVTARLVPALVRPLRPLAPKPGFSKPLLKPLPVYKQGQTERQAWLAGMYSCFAFPSLTCFSKLAEQKMLTFCSSWSWPHWGLWPPSGSAPSSPPLLPLPRLLLPRAALWRS